MDFTIITLAKTYGNPVHKLMRYTKEIFDLS